MQQERRSSVGGDGNCDQIFHNANLQTVDLGSHSQPRRAPNTTSRKLCADHEEPHAQLSMMRANGLEGGMYFSTLVTSHGATAWITTDLVLGAGTASMFCCPLGESY